MSARELKALHDQKKMKQYLAVFDAALNKRYNFKLRAKLDTGEQRRTRVEVLRFQEPNFQADSSKLLAEC